jgi:hypothetical protein
MTRVFADRPDDRRTVGRVGDVAKPMSAAGFPDLTIRLSARRPPVKESKAELN